MTQHFGEISLNRATYWLGGFLVYFSHLNLPIPGGGTKSITAILWFPIFLYLTTRMFVTGKACLIHWMIAGLLILGVGWGVVIYFNGGDVSEWVYRTAALTAGLSVLLVVSGIKSKYELHSLIKGIIIGAYCVFIYGVIVQVPAVLGIDLMNDLDLLIRQSLLSRAKDSGRLTLFAEEPSFAAFQIVAALSIALIYREFLSKTLFRGVVALGMLCLVFAGSITAIVFIVLASLIILIDLRKKILVWLFLLLLTLTMIFNQIVPYNRLENLEHDQSAVARYTLFMSTWRAGSEAWFLGLGPGQYNQNWDRYFTSDPDLTGRLPISLQARIGSGDKIKPFSVFGGVFAEFGLVGLMLLILPFLILFRRLKYLNIKSKVIFSLSLTVVILSFLSAYPISMPNMWILFGVLYLFITYGNHSKTDFRSD